jgi:hypothetical protein
MKCLQLNLSFVELQLYSEIVIYLVLLKQLIHMHLYRIDDSRRWNLRAGAEARE